MGKWKEVKLSEVYDVRDGTHDSPKYVQEGYPLVTSKNLKGNSVDLSNVKYISQDDYDAINKRSKVDIGDVLFAMIGTIGNPILIEEAPNYAIKNVALFKKKDLNQDSKFLTYYLGSERILDKMKSEAKGATQKFVGLTYLRNFKIPLPPLPEQQRIVAKLDGLFAKIDQAISLLEANLQHTQALMGSVLDEEFGKLGEKYKKVTLPDVVDDNRYSIKRGPFGSALKKLFFVEKGYKVYEQKNAIKDDFSLGHYYVNDEKFEELKAFEVKPGDIIISCSGTIGKIAIAPKNIEKGIINQALLKISLDPKKITNKYFAFFFQNYVNQGELKSKGAAIKNIVSVKELKKIPFPLPKVGEQEIIVSRLNKQQETIEDFIKTQTQKLDHLKALKSSLLDQAFKGAL